MNKRWILTVAVVTLLSAAVALAQPAPGKQGPRAGRGKALAAYLQLTPDQIATAKQLRSDAAATIKPLVQNGQDLRKQLDAALSATPPDNAAVGKLTVALHSVRDQVRSARADEKAKFVAILTPDQKTKFEALEAAGGYLKHRRQAAMGMAPQ